jgi:outer membrane immunogenic protein
MKSIYAGLLGLTLTSALALTANATDIYRGGLKDGPAPVYTPAQSWTGFYLGVNGGYGWTNSDYYDSSPSGGFGGGQIGYNWQGALGLGSPWVLGIEADLQGSGISDSYGGYEVGLNYFGTVRGRVGYAIDRTLLYVTGGYAYGEVEFKDGRWSASDTQTGYVIGGGLEYKLNPAWSLKGEYQFVSLDAKDPDWSLHDYSDRSEVHTLRVGLNYHVGHGFAPLN